MSAPSQPRAGRAHRWRPSMAALPLALLDVIMVVAALAAVLSQVAAPGDVWRSAALRTAPAASPIVDEGPGPWIDRYRGLSGALPPETRPIDGAPRAPAGPAVVGSSLHVAPRAGDLVLAAELNLDRPGTYWAYAELWGGAGGERPIAFARRRLGPLSAGRGRLELLFGGAIIRARGVDGPYWIRRLRVSQVDDHPPRHGPSLDVPAAIGAVRAGTFY